MAVNVEMPKLSDTMTEGTLVKWVVAEGATVEVGDILAEIETDKATMEMEAFEEGVLAKILVPEGGKAPVGANIAVIAEEGEDPGSITGAVDSGSVSTPVASSAPTSTEATVAEVPAAVLEAQDGSRVKASPLARKLAVEKQVALSAIQGSGPGGRIVKVDVERAAAQPAPAPVLSAPTAAPASSSSVQAIPAMAASEEDTIVPLSSMRKIIADRLMTSKATIPHFYLHVECDVENLFALRKQINEQSAEQLENKFSVNDFVVAAVIKAASEHSAINAQFAGDHIVEYKHVGLSVAISIDNGLVTPVIKEAESKSLLQISKEIKDLAKRARGNQLKPSEFDGGTVTVSNLGAWGVESFDAIVNPPQAAIISVGGAIKKPVVKGDQIVPGTRMNIGLSCDHRVVDGAVGADFLNTIKRYIESPNLMLL